MALVSCPHVIHGSADGTVPVRGRGDHDVADALDNDVADALDNIVGNVTVGGAAGYLLPATTVGAYVGSRAAALLMQFVEKLKR